MDESPCRRVLRPCGPEGSRRANGMEGTVAIQHSHDLQNSSDMQDFDRSDEPQRPFSDDDLHLDRRHAAPTFVQTNLISDGFVQAQVTDPNLINPWGLSFSPTSP